MIPENDCGFYIKHISEALQRNANNALRSADLTVSQVSVLYLLEATPNGKLSLKDLEKRLQVAQSTAAGVIARLEQKVFVESYGSSEDKRIKMVRITQVGIACCAEARDRISHVEEYLLSCLTDTERLMFSQLLKKVSDHM